MRANRFLVVAVAVVGAALAGGLAGCVSTTPGYATAAATTTVGVPYLSGDQVLGAITSAVRGATGVHLVGSTSASGTLVRFDVQLNQDSASGTIAARGATLPFRSVGGMFYYQLTDSVLAALPGVSPTVRAQALNKWISRPAPSADGQGPSADTANVANYPQFAQWLTGFLSGADAPTFSGTAEVAGARVYQYQADDGTTVSVAISSPHYLVRLVNSGVGESFDFIGWNTQVPVTAPAPADMYTAKETFNI